MVLGKNSKSEIVNKLRVSPNDCGSVQVQIALLTERIKQITDHVGKNDKDFSSKRGLLKIVAQRRKFLDYLKKKNHEEYAKVIELLELRK